VNSVIGDAVDQTVLNSPQSGLALVVFGGDYFHADNKNNQTARSHNALDVDGRYDKVIGVGTRLAVRIVDRHLRTTNTSSCARSKATMMNIRPSLSRGS
jgi:hypothetical protein